MSHQQTRLPRKLIRVQEIQFTVSDSVSAEQGDRAEAEPEAGREDVPEPGPAAPGGTRVALGGCVPRPRRDLSQRSIRKVSGEIYPFSLGTLTTAAPMNNR